MSTVVVRRSVIVKIRSYGLLKVIKVILDTKNYRFEASCVVDPMVLVKILVYMVRIVGYKRDVYYKIT